MNDATYFEELGRRAVACNGWRWLSGMLLLGRDDLRSRKQDADWWNENPDEFAHLLPDLRDPATLGCMLALWMDAWPAELDDRSRRCAEIQDAISDHDVRKLAEAMVSALESLSITQAMGRGAGCSVGDDAAPGGGIPSRPDDFGQVMPADPPEPELFDYIQQPIRSTYLVVERNGSMNIVVIRHEPEPESAFENVDTVNIGASVSGAPVSEAPFPDPFAAAIVVTALQKVMSTRAAAPVALGALGAAGAIAACDLALTWVDGSPNLPRSMVPPSRLFMNDLKAAIEQLESVGPS